MSIGDWMDTKSGGVITGYAFGFGAAIVIIGALFKIMHWPGASVILTMGMGTEALLFVITAFGNPHTPLHWERMFPVISDDTTEGQTFKASRSHSAGIAELGSDKNDGAAINVGNITAASISVANTPAAGAVNGTVAGGGVAGGTLNAVAGTNISSLSDEDVEKLNKGISKLSETAEKLSTLGEAGTVAEKLAQNMAVASGSLENYNNSQIQINEATTVLVNSYKGIAANISSASQSSTEFANSMSNVNRSLLSANSAYELQLKAIESANTEIEAFKQNTAKLNSQISDLNNIYGNMLNALA